MTETDIQKKVNKMNIWFNIKQIIDNYDELEPILKEYFDKKAQKEKWSERE